jgi:hypothetical protein
MDEQKSICGALMPLLSPSLLFGSALLWGHYSPNRVLDADPRAFFWAMGVVFSNIAVSWHFFLLLFKLLQVYLIIAQMSSTKVPLLNGLLMGYLALVAVSLLRILGAAELLALRISAILFTLAHLHLGICVVSKYLV